MKWVFQTLAIDVRNTLPDSYLMMKDVNLMYSNMLNSEGIAAVKNTYGIIRRYRLQPK